MKTGRQINENNEKQYYLNTGKTLCLDSEGTSIEAFTYNTDYLKLYATKEWVEENYLKNPETEYYTKPENGIPTNDIADGVVTSNKLSDDLQSKLSNMMLNGSISIDTTADTHGININLEGNTYPVISKTNGAITSDYIGSEAVITSKIADGAITANKIASNTITSNLIASNTITSNQIANNTITSNLIASNTITNNEIASNTIVYDNLSQNIISSIIPPFNGIDNYDVSIMLVGLEKAPNYLNIHFSKSLHKFLTMDNKLKFYSTWPDSLYNNETNNYPSKGRMFYNVADGKLYFYTGGTTGTLKEVTATTFIEVDKLKDELDPGGNGEIPDSAAIAAYIDGNYYSSDYINTNYLTAAEIDQDYVTSNQLNEVITRLEALEEALENT